MILGQVDDDVESLLAADHLGQPAEDGPGVLENLAEQGLLVGLGTFGAGPAAGSP